MSLLAQYEPADAARRAVGDWVLAAFDLPWLPLLVAGIGAAAVYFLLPDQQTGQARARRAATVLGSLAIAGLILWMTRMQMRRTYAAQLDDSPNLRFYFYLFAAVAIVAAARAITHARPIYCALYFALAVLAVAAALLLLMAPSLGVGLVVIMAGGMLAFAVALTRHTDDGGRQLNDHDRRLRTPLVALAVSFLLVAAIGWSIRQLTDAPGPIHELAMRQEIPPPSGGPASLGCELLTRHMLAVEAAAVLLLMAVISSIVLVRQPVVPTDKARAG